MKHGFSLFELLIAITIISILSAIAYPLYTDHIAKTQWREATLTLMEISNRLEEAHSISGTYEQIDSASLLPEYRRELPFTFIISDITQDSYLIKAIPQPTFKKTFGSCSTLLLSSDGYHCW